MYSAPLSRSSTAEIPKRSLVVARSASIVQTPSSGFRFDATRWPTKPYCSADLRYGVRIRSLATAARLPYIQANRPGVCAWLIFDIDRPKAALAWEEAGLPAPTWMTINPENGHAHLVWGLASPVTVSEQGSRKAVRYLQAIRCAFAELLGADPDYSGLITKNPAHESWRTWNTGKLYELGELEEYVDLKGVKGSRVRYTEGMEAGFGRNVQLFNTLRKWAYQEIQSGSSMPHYEDWANHVHARAERLNQGLADPLRPIELRSIAKSVARWVWKKGPEGVEALLSERQREKGIKGGLASARVRRKAADAGATVAQQLRDEGLSFREIAGKLKISVGTAHRWCSVKPLSDNSPKGSAGRPKEILISSVKKNSPARHVAPEQPAHLSPRAHIGGNGVLVNFMPRITSKTDPRLTIRGVTSEITGLLPSPGMARTAPPPGATSSHALINSARTLAAAGDAWRQSMREAALGP